MNINYTLNRVNILLSIIKMTFSKSEVTGKDVHKTLKEMTKNYGLMMEGVNPKLLGQNRAEQIQWNSKKTGDLYDNISRIVKVEAKEMLKPSDSCGDVSNQVCDLLLGIEKSKNLGKVNYQILSDTGDNLKSALKNSNLLIRFEVDRICDDGDPKWFTKIASKEFDLKTCTRNEIYLLENKLSYVDNKGNLIDIEVNKEKYGPLFNHIKEPRIPLYFYGEVWDDEDKAVREVIQIYDQYKEHSKSWISTHSFTVFAPQTLNDELRPWYPYQAYFGSHSLQDWYSGDKDETLSKMGSEQYIKQLALLGTTTETKVRSDIYAELFSKPGREKIFCTNINEKSKELRVKFKIAEVDLGMAYSNLKELQQYIDTYGTEVSEQVKNYALKAEEGLTEQLKKLLIKPNTKQKSVGQSQFSLFGSPTSSIENTISSLLNKENLKMIVKQADTLPPKKQEQLVEFLKTLPQKELEEIKSESNTAQKAWDEKYGLLLYSSKPIS